MADILIRGMEMPKDGHIVVRIYANGDVCEPTPCPGVWRKVGELSPLPERHGRLIDADELREDWLQNGENEFVYDTNSVLDSIDNAPTIVPAEGGSEDG